MKLREIAFSRCGDKGDTSNVCVFPYDEGDWQWIRSWLTVEVVRDKYGPLVKGDVARYEFPNICGLNFVMDEALEGGGSMSLKSDTLGKCYQSLILDVDVPEGIDPAPSTDRR